MKSQQPDSWIWWKHGVIYHIYPRSFKDSNNDGVGDIQGIISKLNYLSNLGVDAIWLSPVYLSPNIDFGYDVADYRKIEPIYGSLDDFNLLLKKAHELGIKVICDMILNHTSDQHPWFLEAKSSKDNPKRDWYIWRDGYNNKLPNNWRSAAGGTAWEYDKITNQYYYHSFFKEQPDLNWRNPELQEIFFEELKFWLNLEVDGFRLDVINLIIKDKKFRNNPNIFGLPLLQKHIFTRNRSRSHKIVMDLRNLLDEYHERVMVGEIYTMPPGDSELVASYLNEGKGIHMAFDFSLMFRHWNARRYYKCIRTLYKHITEKGWPCFVLSNHDLYRSVDRFPWRRNKDEKAKVAATLLLTLKGTPFIYYGEEIGMRNTPISYKNIKDPLGKKYWPFYTGRDKARTPMQWDSNENAGFSTVNPWLPIHTNAVTRNVEIQLKDENSILNHYRSLITLRKEQISLQQGRWIPIIAGKNGIIIYSRIIEQERTIIVLNFTGRRKKIDLPEHSHGYVIHSTHRDIGEIYYFQDHWVYPYEATIYKRNN